MYLKKYKQIKIHFDINGKIVKIEKEKNNTWVIGSLLKNDFKNLPNHLINNNNNNNNNNIVITLKQ